MERSPETPENYVATAAEIEAAENWLRAKFHHVLSTEEILDRIKTLKKRVGYGRHSPSVIASEIIDDYYRLLGD